MSATYSLQEVAAEMRLDDMSDPVRWLTKQIKLGRITARRVGRSWRMTRDDIEAAFIRLLNHLAERWEKAKAADFGEIRAWWERRRVNRFLREHREAWHSRDELWGTVGYVLHTMKRSRQVVEWLSDWRALDGRVDQLLRSFALVGRRREDRGL